MISPGFARGLAKCHRVHSCANGWPIDLEGVRCAAPRATAVMTCDSFPTLDDERTLPLELLRIAELLRLVTSDLPPICMTVPR